MSAIIKLTTRTVGQAFGTQAGASIRLVPAGRRSAATGRLCPLGYCYVAEVSAISALFDALQIDVAEGAVEALLAGRTVWHPEHGSIRVEVAS